MMAVLGMLRVVPSWCYWILALLTLCLGCTLYGDSRGASRVQTKWDIAEAERKTQNARAIKDRLDENIALKAQYDADRALMKKEFNAKLSDYSDRLAHSEWLRLGAAWCDGATPGSGTIPSTAGGNDANPDNRVVGADLQRAIDRFKERIAAGLETGRLAQQVIIKNGLAPP